MHGRGLDVEEMRMENWVRERWWVLWDLIGWVGA